MAPTTLQEWSHTGTILMQLDFFYFKSEKQTRQFEVLVGMSRLTRVSRDSGMNLRQEPGCPSPW